RVAFQLADEWTIHLTVRGGDRLLHERIDRRTVRDGWFDICHAREAIGPWAARFRARVCEQDRDPIHASEAVTLHARECVAVAVHSRPILGTYQTLLDPLVQMRSRLLASKFSTLTTKRSSYDEKLGPSSKSWIKGSAHGSGDLSRRCDSALANPWMSGAKG